MCSLKAPTTSTTSPTSRWGGSCSNAIPFPRAGPATPVNLSGVVTHIGNELLLDFGAAGIGGNRNTTAGDGYYQLSIDLDGDGTFETVEHFYRLLGDVNGDRA